MRLTSTVLSFIAVLHVASAMAERDARIVANSQRAVFSKCVHEANQANLTGQDRSKHVSDCVAANSEPDPMGLEIKDCVEKAKPHRGTPEWANQINPCLYAVSEKYKKN